MPTSKEQQIRNDVIAAIKYFDQVQIDRSFDGDFSTTALKLAIVQTRLCRWAKSVGLNDSSQTSLSSLTDNEREITRKLKNIKTSFEDSPEEEISAKVYKAPSDLDTKNGGIYKIFKALAASHFADGVKQTASTPIWKAKEERHTNELLDNQLKSPINTLVEISLKLGPKLNELCAEDAKRFTSREDLVLLHQILPELDPELKKVLPKEVTEGGITYNITFSGANNRGVQVGHNTGTVNSTYHGRD